MVVVGGRSGNRAVVVHYYCYSVVLRLNQLGDEEEPDHPSSLKSRHPSPLAPLRRSRRRYSICNLLFFSRQF